MCKCKGDDKCDWKNVQREQEEIQEQVQVENNVVQHVIAFDPDLMQIEQEIADESVGDDARDLSTDTADHYGQLNEGNVFSVTLSDVSNNITNSITENSSQNLAVEPSTETEDQQPEVSRPTRKRRTRP